MSNREHRRFLKNQLAESDRLRVLLHDHPLMGPLWEQRESELKAELEQLPTGGREPRTILFFTGEPVDGSRGIDAQFATSVLTPFLEMVKTEYSAEKHGRVGERGPRRGEEEARLFITGLPRGSFGIELSQPPADDFIAEEQLSNVLVRLTEVLESAGKSDEDFVHALEDVSPRVHGRLKEFFETLSSHRANIRMQTGDLEFELRENRIAEALQRVGSLHTEYRDIDLKGEFRGATLDTWKFDFRTEEGKTLSGKLSEDLPEQEVADMLGLTNQPCTAHLKEIKVTSQGGAVRTRYELLGLARRKES